MSQGVAHTKTLVALRRIEGQIKGIQKMVEKQEYCVDIVNQIHAAIHALHRVAEKIFARHIENCVVDAFRSRSAKQKQQKINEIMNVIRRLHSL